MRFILCLSRFIFALATSPTWANTLSEPYTFDSNAIVIVKVKGSANFCSGVIVGSNTILTATHCVFSLSDNKYFPPSQLQIGIGNNVFDNQTQWLKVTQITALHTIPLQTVNDFLSHDIIQLTSPTPNTITPLKLARLIDPNSTLVAWGFGEDEWGYFGLKKSRKLTEVSIDSKFVHFLSGACRGDSGGPILNTKNQVVGIVSMSEKQHCVNTGPRLAQRITFTKNSNSETTGTSYRENGPNNVKLLEHNSAPSKKTFRPQTSP